MSDSGEAASASQQPRAPPPDWDVRRLGAAAPPPRPSAAAAPATPPVDVFVVSADHPPRSVAEAAAAGGVSAPPPRNSPPPKRRWFRRNRRIALLAVGFTAAVIGVGVGLKGWGDAAARRAAVEDSEINQTNDGSPGTLSSKCEIDGGETYGCVVIEGTGYLACYDVSDDCMVDEVTRYIGCFDASDDKKCALWVRDEFGGPETDQCCDFCEPCPPGCEHVIQGDCSNLMEGLKEMDGCGCPGDPDPSPTSTVGSSPSHPPGSGPEGPSSTPTAPPGTLGSRCEIDGGDTFCMVLDGFGYTGCLDVSDDKTECALWVRDEAAGPEMDQCCNFCELCLPGCEQIIQADCSNLMEGLEEMDGCGCPGDPDPSPTLTVGSSPTHPPSAEPSPALTDGSGLSRAPSVEPSLAPTYGSSSPARAPFAEPTSAPTEGPTEAGDACHVEGRHTVCTYVVPETNPPMATCVDHDDSLTTCAFWIRFGEDDLCCDGCSFCPDGCKYDFAYNCTNVANNYFSDCVCP